MRSSPSPAVAFAASAAASLVHHIPVGLLGWWTGRRALLILYAGYGLASLAHYTVAPLSAHTPGMHLTIVFETAAAAAFLFFLLLPKSR